ncbi:MAG TPA: sensor protein, partial [Roseomonas sp.]
MSERILILAPRGRDAQVIEQVLRREGMISQICSGLACLQNCLEDDVGGVIVTEEALTGPEVEPVLAWCDAQPPWSDIPVIVMATKQAGRRSALAAGVLERLGNVVLLERPVNSETLASAARSSLRARRRQYETRSLLLERDQNERELRELNETLE